MPNLLEPCILIVDDQEANVQLLEQILKRAGYHNLVSTRDSRQVIPLFETRNPDLILLDLHMPHLDGYEVLTRLKPLVPEGVYLPILVLTADIFPDAKKRALSLGAKDFVSKPFDFTEVLLRIHNLLETRLLHLELQQDNAELEHKVQLRTQDLEAAQIEMLERLVLAAESRDDDTGEHTRRVGELASALALRAGWPEAELDLIRRAATLHDIGKIGIPDHILLKPGKLTPEEFEFMKTHAAIGSRMLAGSRFRLLQLAEEIAHYHHEKWDGSGYFGMMGERIPVAARIVALADVFDVLTHARPYKKAWPLSEAIALIEGERGRHFDPSLVDIFLEMIRFNELAALGGAVESAEHFGPVHVSGPQTAMQT
jgi:putative two-component system response regulator